MLPAAVKRARKSTGKTVYLTATPRKKMLRKVQRGQLMHYRITSRFHGFPLAIPVIKPIGNWRQHMKKGLVIQELVEYVSHLCTKNRYGYLFVPHVRDIEMVKSYLQLVVLPYVFAMDATRGNQIFTVESVHAEDARRSEIVQHFRQHHIQLLITTTILERGVTIAYCDVAVLGSDDAVYDAASLIQIAGRAGRKLEDPVGNVWFFPQVRTKPQQECISTLKENNKLLEQQKMLELQRNPG